MPNNDDVLALAENLPPLTATERAEHLEFWSNRCWPVAGGCGQVDTHPHLPRGERLRAERPSVVVLSSCPATKVLP